MISATKTDARKLIPILNMHGTEEEVAQAVIDKAFGIFVSKAKFAVVGQVNVIDGTPLLPKDDGARSGVLDLFSTETQARAAAGSIALRQAGQGDAAAAWVVNVFHQKPKDFWGEAKAAHVGGSYSSETHADRLVAWIEKRGPYTYGKEPLCSQLFLTGTNCIQACHLPHRHEGAHEGFFLDRESDLTSPRRLTGLKALPSPTDNEGFTDEDVE